MECYASAVLSYICTSVEYFHFPLFHPALLVMNIVLLTFICLDAFSYKLLSSLNAASESKKHFYFSFLYIIGNIN